MKNKPCFVSQERARTGWRRERRYSALAPRLLEFFALHRAALARHVQRQFCCRLYQDRSTRMHLQTLVAHGDLSVIREPGIAGRNVYLITSRGLRHVGEDACDVDYPRWRRRQTGNHLDHELLITELAVAVGECAQRRRDLHVPWQERFGLARHPAFRELVPDFAFLFHHPSGRLVCLVEVSSGEESPTRLQQKLDKYAAWSESPEPHAFLSDLYREHGAQSPRPQFRLLFVAHNRRTGNDLARLSQFLALVVGLPEAMRWRVWGATAADLLRAGSLDEPLWVRQQDLEPRLCDLVAMQTHRRPARLRGLLRDAPRHSLFPPAQGGVP